MLIVCKKKYLGVWGARAALPIESAPVASLVYTKLKINKKTR